MNDDFAKYIRFKRNQLGLSLIEMEQITKISSSYIWRLEQGECSPSINVLVDLCKGLCTDPIELVKLLIDDYDKNIKITFEKSIIEGELKDPYNNTISIERKMILLQIVDIIITSKKYKKRELEYKILKLLDQYLIAE